MVSRSGLTVPNLGRVWNGNSRPTISVIPNGFLPFQITKSYKRAGLRPTHPNPRAPKRFKPMEYIIVQIKDQPNVDTDVLINRRPNGRTGVLVMLGGPGLIFVSADWPGAQEQTVDVKNTTPNHPIDVTIECT
jgi:hypothetical protein